MSGKGGRRKRRHARRMARRARVRGRACYYDPASVEISIGGWPLDVADVLAVDVRPGRP